MKYIIYLILFFTYTASAQIHQQDSSAKQVNTTDTLLKKDTIPYATLCFYRSFIPKFYAPIKKVPILINDTLVHSLKANTMIFVKLFRAGKYRIALDAKGDTQIPVNIKMGKEYFFRCEIVAGLWGGKPLIEPVSPGVGKVEAGLVAEEK